MNHSMRLGASSQHLHHGQILPSTLLQRQLAFVTDVRRARPATGQPRLGLSHALNKNRPYTYHESVLRARRHELYTVEDWNRHRSGDRFLRHLQTFFESSVVRGIMIPVLLVTLLTSVVAGLNVLQEVAPHMLPFRLPQVSIEPIQLTSFALSLLLVFRTNASYARFMDARSSFGRITTITRDIARQVFFWMRRPQEGPIKAALARWLVAFSKSSMVHLRSEHELREELSDTLRPDEIERVASSAHAPLYCLQVITWLIYEAKDGLPKDLLHRLDENVTQLASALFSCERILNTPIPLSYTRHTSRFLIAWMTALPFCLWRYCNLAMVPIAMLISFVLLGIEEIGVYIEEPFSVLPLQGLCEKMQKSVANMLRESADIIANMKVDTSEPPVEGPATT